VYIIIRYVWIDPDRIAENKRLIC